MEEQPQLGVDAEIAQRIAVLKAMTDDEITESWNRTLEEAGDMDEDIEFLRAAARRMFKRLDEEDGGWEDVAPPRKSPSPESGQSSG